MDNIHNPKEIRNKSQFQNDPTNNVNQPNNQIMNDPFAQYINNLQNNNNPNSNNFPKAESNFNNKNNLPSLEQIESASGYNAKHSFDNLNYNIPVSNLENINNDNKFHEINANLNNNNLNFNENQNLLNNYNNHNHNNNNNFENININANRIPSNFQNQMNPAQFNRGNSIPEAPIPIGITVDVPGQAEFNPNQNDKQYVASKISKRISEMEAGQLDDSALESENKSIIIEADKRNFEALPIEKANVDNLMAPSLTVNNDYNSNNNNFNNIINNNDNNENINKENQNIELSQRPVALENNIPLPQVQIAPEPVFADSTTIISVIEDICAKYCLFHLIVFALGIVVTVLVFVLQSNLRYSEGYFYQDIYKSWNQNLLSSIYTSGCEAFEDSLIQEKWPGTKAGCNCYTSVLSGFCSSDNICTSMPSRDPIPISFWRGVRYCRKTDNYFQNKTYFDLDVKGNANECTSGSRSCGVVDSFGNHLCVENNKACPVNSIKFFNTNDYEVKKSNFTSEDIVILGSSGALVYSSKNFNDSNNNKIPIGFKISNGQPCLNTYYENIGPSVYVLDFYSVRNYCLKYTDPSDNSNNGTTLNSEQFFFDNNYQEIDKIYMEDLYVENGITQVTYNLPLFPKEIYKRDISLYSRNYFGLKTSCYNNIKKNNMAKDLMSDLNTMNKLLEIDGTGLTVVTIIMLTFLFIIVSGFASYSETIRFTILIKVDRCSFWLYFVFAVIVMAFALAILICLAVILSSVHLSPTFDLVFNDPNCLDSYGLELYQQLIPNLTFIRKSALASIIMSAAIILFLMLYSCIGFYVTSTSLYD